jgi:hypothetical protein
MSFDPKARPSVSTKVKQDAAEFWKAFHAPFSAWYWAKLAGGVSWLAMGGSHARGRVVQPEGSGDKRRSRATVPALNKIGRNSSAHATGSGGAGEDDIPGGGG